MLNTTLNLSQQFYIFFLIFGLTSASVSYYFLSLKKRVSCFETQVRYVTFVLKIVLYKFRIPNHVIKVTINHTKLREGLKSNFLIWEEEGGRKYEKKLSQNSVNLFRME